MAHCSSVFAQLLRLVPRHAFEALAKEHHVGGALRGMSRWKQFVAMVAAQLTGTLDITGQRCTDLDGTLDVVLIDARGDSRRIAGRVTVQMLDASSIRFDALIGAVPRQHLATLRGDSLIGSWLELSGSAGGATGQFKAKRGGS